MHVLGASAVLVNKMSSVDSGRLICLYAGGVPDHAAEPRGMVLCIENIVPCLLYTSPSPRD